MSYVATTVASSVCWGTSGNSAHRSLRGDYSPEHCNLCFQERNALYLWLALLTFDTIMYEKKQQQTTAV